MNHSGADTLCFFVLPVDKVSLKPECFDTLAPAETPSFGFTVEPSQWCVGDAWWGSSAMPLCLAVCAAVQWAAPPSLAPSVRAAGGFQELSLPHHLWGLVAVGACLGGTGVIQKSPNTHKNSSCAMFHPKRQLCLQDKVNKAALCRRNHDPNPFQACVANLVLCGEQDSWFALYWWICMGSVSDIFKPTREKE